MFQAFSAFGRRSMRTSQSVQLLFIRRLGIGFLIASAIPAAEAFAQGHFSIEGFKVGQKLHGCPPSVTKRPAGSGRWMCIFPENKKFAFGQSTRAFGVSADESGEIDLILAVGVSNPRKAALAVAQIYGAADSTKSFATGETIWEWMRDDDMLAIVGSKKDPFISISGISPSAARNAAARFSQIAEKCLVDVRDRGVSYEKSSFCLSASSLHIDYLNVDQHQHWVNTAKVPKHAYDVSQARAILWSAVAISNERYGSKRTSLW